MKTKKHTIGIDLGDRRHAVCVLNAGGDIVEEESIVNTRACLLGNDQQKKMKKFQVMMSIFTLALAGCVGPGRPPRTFLPPIADEYYVCEKCGSLHGGIYGKGPLESFATLDASKCRHRWHQIPKTEFQKLAAEHFPAEWEKASEYVKRIADEPIQQPSSNALDLT